MDTIIIHDTIRGATFLFLLLPFLLVMIDLLDAEKPPFRLLLGGYAHTIFAKKLASLDAEMKAWKDVGLPTDFPPGE